MLNELDRELERRGHRFVRYADEANIYVRSQRAGERVMVSVERFLSQRLKLVVNRVRERPDTAQLRPRDMYLLTTGSWVVVCTFAALPMVFISHISYTDAFFETMSGITTTGSTVLSGLDTASPGLLIWRSMLHWLGGIGFIGMAVAILPLLRVGGDLALAFDLLVFLHYHYCRYRLGSGSHWA